jgi:two-component system sensor histidine kinase HydH
MNEPGEKNRMQSALGFENAVCGCMLSGVIVLDPRAQMATLNPEASQLLGIPAEQGLKISVENLPESIAKVVREALAAGKLSITRQIDLPGQSGSSLAHVNAIPVKSTDGDSAVVLTIHALNPASPFLRQIRQLDRLANAGTLAAGLAHEIKNALVAGRTFLDLLLEKNTDEELVQIVRRENGRIDSIVSRMLRFASITTPAMSSLHVHEVLDHALRLVQPLLADKTTALERAFQAKPDIVKGDEYELQQAFVNLLLNALDAISANGALKVTTETTTQAGSGARRLCISLKDDGAGISPEHMRHLFEPFFTTKASGTGLGLVITRRIIQEHGGSISVESHPGQGTTFTVLLPVLAEGRGTQPGGLATAARDRNPN